MTNEFRQRGLFDLIKRLLPFWRPEREASQRSLVGRIYAELQKDVHRMWLQLNELKSALREELNSHDEGQLWISFEAVINPLLREYRLIERELNLPSKGEEEHHSKVKNANEWIDRAKLWVALCSNSADRKSMIQAVVDHTLHILDRIIDRDLKTLVDYKEHELKLLGLSKEAFEAVNHRLDSDLAPYIDGLLIIKNEKPDNLQIASLVHWKAHVNEERNKLFDAALQMIDNVVNSVAPEIPLGEEQEHLKELIHRIAYLENEAEILTTQIDISDLRDLVKRQMLEASLDAFEEEVHQIHHDLRLTPELIDRIQLLFQELEGMRCRFKEAI
jgi:hypothetical protein